METQHQSHLLGFCRHGCGNELWDNEDWLKPRWEGFNPHCQCELEFESEGEDDSKLQEIDDEMDRIIDQINESTKRINEYKRKENGWTKLLGMTRG
jgi:hypothetical protein